MSGEYSKRESAGVAGGSYRRERGRFAAGVIEDREGEGVGRDLHHPGAKTPEWKK